MCFPRESYETSVCFFRANKQYTALPESSNKPFDRLDRGHQPNSATRKAQEGLNSAIQFLILRGCELGAILALALLAEDGGLESRKASIELAEFLETLVAGGVKSLVALGSGDSRLPDQRLGMGSLLRLDVESRLRIGGHLRQLSSERGRHDF